MKKTPIAELKEELLRKFKNYNNHQLYNIIEKYEQKEKAFAFDCFEAGESYNNQFCGAGKDVEPDFEIFYSQYATQHPE